MRQVSMRLRPLVVAVVCAWGGQVQAAEDKTGNVQVLPPIEVISTTPLPGFAVPVNQVPSNVRTLKADDVRARQSLDITDYLNNAAPGVNINEAQNNPYQPNLNYHGFMASPLAGAPQGVSVYQDGVRVNSLFGDTVHWDLIPKNAIANMNLMPGSNALFGLNTLGGALSVTTKSGLTAPGGGMQAYVGSFGRRALEGEYGGKLDNGGHYFVAGNIFKEDGWRQYSKSNVRQLFSKVGWKGEQADVTISLTLADNELYGNGYVPDSFLKRFGYRTVYTQPDITRNKHNGLTGQFNYWLADNLSLNLVAYYRNTDTDSYNADATGNEDGPQGVINRGSIRQNAYGVSGQLSWETARNVLTGGLTYDWGDLTYGQSVQSFNKFNASRGVDVAAGLQNIVQRVKLNGDTDTWGVFATDTFKITPAFAVTLSGRYNTTSISNRDGLIPVAGSTGLIGGDTRLSLTGNHRFSRFNPALGATYTLSPALNFFGGYTEGSRAPSVIELGCASKQYPCNLPNAMAGDPPLKQVVSRTWEAGVRGRLDNGIRWSAAAYTTENSDDIQFVSATARSGYFQNVGKTLREGFDFGLDGKLNDFSWSASYSLVRATYQTSFDLQADGNPFKGTNCAGVASKGTICARAGNRIPGIPRHQFKLRGAYQVLPIWNVGVNLVLFSDQFAYGNENNADPKGKVGGYSVLNLDTRVDFGNTGWSLFGKVNNVFDRRYYSAAVLRESAFNLTTGAFVGEGDSARLVAPGAPRSAWVGLRYDFGGVKTTSGNL